MMAKTAVRFTAWLTTSERQALKLEANRQGSSENFVVRLALRRLLNLPAPVDGEKPAENQPA